MPHGVRPSKKRRRCLRPVRIGVILYREGRVLAVRHAHKDPEKEYWVLPGGGLESDETPSEGAVREMMEETCLQVRVDRLAYIHDQEYGGVRQLSLYFLCSIVAGEMRMSAELMDKAGEYTNELVWIEPDALARERFFPEVLRQRLIDDSRNGFSIEGLFLVD
jgi:8-oxo-dGTP diphosphatase